MCFRSEGASCHGDSGGGMYISRSIKITCRIDLPNPQVNVIFVRLNYFLHSLSYQRLFVSLSLIILKKGNCIDFPSGRNETGSRAQQSIIGEFRLEF